MRTLTSGFAFLPFLPMAFLKTFANNVFYHAFKAICGIYETPWEQYIFFKLDFAQTDDAHISC